ncbi:hypothetical protein [Rhodococcus sp. NCIMB 12038]|uniref:hypothetical protein n=1 Tax=Rhodococcus sp. NCIMB 12038 TaxID=933800 RepID=UPI000B3CD850|nr:hypothetical protein [Rhodococcus sp. NCIMB 12038]OUS97414.1 hypothetical protein CA951_03475 [Rhodococcus sp. NCIMB 12038]
MHSTAYDLDAEYAAEVAAAMDDIGAQWVPTVAGTHGAPDLMMFPTGIYPGRQILSIPGITHPFTPNTCRDVDAPGMWVLDGLILVCRGCGIDCT